jgi:hypothetical protein
MPKISKNEEEEIATHWNDTDYQTVAPRVARLFLHDARNQSQTRAWSIFLQYLEEHAEHALVSE